MTDLGHLLEERTIGTDYLDLVFDIPTEQRHSNMTYEVLRLYRQQNMRKATHLGNIAHELKNPLNGVKGFANLMRKNYERGELEKADAFYEKFTQSCVFLEHMVNELLDLTYIETGHLKPKKSEFDVIELTKTVVQSMSQWQSNIILGWMSHFLIVPLYLFTLTKSDFGKSFRT